MKNGYSYRIEMAGQRFNKWTVLEFSHIDPKCNLAHWKCKCDCGNIGIVAGGSLRRGKSKSCGCYRGDFNRKVRTKPHKIIDGIECKRCYACKEWMELSKFSKAADRLDGLSGQCKSCSKIKRDGKPRNKKYHRDWANNKYKTDIQYRIKSSVQARIRQALKNMWKSARTVELLGCSIQQLKEYLENQFDEKMTWENHGTYWHIDHRKPCSWFDLSKPEQQLACFHYTNLQPLSAIENVRKRDRYAHSSSNA